jgi:hypothetical protein
MNSLDETKSQCLVYCIIKKFMVGFSIFCALWNSSYKMEEMERLLKHASLFSCTYSSMLHETLVPYSLLVRLKGCAIDSWWHPHSVSALQSKCNIQWHLWNNCGPLPPKTKLDVTYLWLLLWYLRAWEKYIFQHKVGANYKCQCRTIYGIRHVEEKIQ